MARCRKCVYLSVVIAAFLSALLLAQQVPKRLILKDGSYQTATKWEIKGDRVHFYSAERYDWEELPTLLVDWPATEKFNRQLEEDRAAGTIRLNKEAAANDQPEKPETPPVAPGLSLPDDGGIFLLDTYKQQQQLVALEQRGGELNKHTGRNILRAAINPLSLSSKQTIELEGAHSAVQAHVSQPVIYLQLDAMETPADGAQVQHPPDASHPPEDHYRIVRLQSKKDSRGVGDLNVAVTGRLSQKENWIKTTSAHFGDWTKITPDEPLAKGEYAVVEILDKGQINLFVWDFGVDASAPENANVRSARPPDTPHEPPELKKH